MLVRRYGKMGALVLVLHGGPAAVGEVAPIARELSASFRVVEPWQRGSGSVPLTVARGTMATRQRLRTIDRGATRRRPA